MFMYIEDHKIYKPSCKLLLDQGYTEANGKNLEQFPVDYADNPI